MLAKERLDMTRQGEASSSDSHGTNARRPGGLLSPEDLIGFQKFTAELVETTVVHSWNH